MKAKIKNVPDIVKVGTGGRMVIPTKLRKKMYINEGSFFAVSHPKDDLLLLKKIDCSIIQDDAAALEELEKAWNEI